MVVFLDDLLFASESYEKAQAKAQEISSLFSSLDFIINRKKSILKPTQKNSTIWASQWTLARWP
jgi:hypothetical protein